jgi:hypothetical protein
MRDFQFKALSVLMVVLVGLSAVPIGNAQETQTEHKTSFLLQNQPDGDKTYELNITIPKELYQYYKTKSHILFSQQDFAKFITPSSLKPVADSLWQIYNNTEDFTNGVLMLVHQIDYVETVAAKYPVETLVEGSGDCDLFAFIAASILEAGGIQTILIYYKDKLHMEIGVDLGAAPTSARVEAFSVTYEGVNYYIGECTGGKWRTGWRIGETPTKYQNTSAQVIALKTVEQISPAQVSAGLRELDPSNISLQVTPLLMLEGDNTVVLGGRIQPEAAKENVTMQARINGGGWFTIGTVETQIDGHFSHNWTTASSGTVEFQASWVGNTQYNGATSPMASVLVLPLFIVGETAALAFLFVVLATAFVKIRGRKQKTTLAQPKGNSTITEHNHDINRD